jgi:hypothetical protein
MLFDDIYGNGGPNITKDRSQSMVDQINKKYKNPNLCSLKTLESNNIKKYITSMPNNSISMLTSPGHRMCAVNIGGKIITTGVFGEYAKNISITAQIGTLFVSLQPVIKLFTTEWRRRKIFKQLNIVNIDLFQKQRGGPCVNLSEIMALFAAEWLKGKSAETINGDNFIKDYITFAQKYQDQKLWNWYMEKADKLFVGELGLNKQVLNKLALPKQELADALKKTHITPFMKGEATQTTGKEEKQAGNVTIIRSNKILPTGTQDDHLNKWIQRANIEKNIEKRSRGSHF